MQPKADWWNSGIRFVEQHLRQGVGVGGKFCDGAALWMSLQRALCLQCLQQAATGETDVSRKGGPTLSSWSNKDTDMKINGSKGINEISEVVQNLAGTLEGGVVSMAEAA